MKVAIVHDWLNQRGGAEAVLAALVDLLPGAPVYTSIYWPAAMPAAFREWPIHTTWMDHLPGIHRRHQPYLLLYPYAFSGLRLEGYDLVISNKSAFCLGVKVSPGTRHLCYCLTPTRFVWDYDTYVGQEEASPLARTLVRPFLGSLRRWERAAAGRVDTFISISREVRARVRRVYGRESTVLYPPVDTERFAPADAHDDYFLVVSRLVPYKRIDVAVQAFSQLGLPLWIAGSGRDQTRLEALAGPSVRFLGRVPDDELGGLLARCRAFVFPGMEDFGIAPVEAMAAGRPVIAVAAGGALDTVVEGVSGNFLDQQTPASLAEAVRRFEAADFDSETIRAQARRFDSCVFRAGMQAAIKQEVGGAWN
jgi:glycosyltransferase involved in cell wall biosynthesis